MKLKRRWFLSRTGLLLPMLAASVAPAQVAVFRRKPAAAGGGGEGTYYYPYSYTVSSFTGGVQWGTSIANGGPVTVTTGGTATKIGAKLKDSGSALDVRLCIYAVGNNTALAGVTVQSPGSTSLAWVDGTISLAVTDATTYIVTAHISNTAVLHAVEAVAGSDYGRYRSGAYSAGNCLAAEVSNDFDYVYAARIFV